MDPTKDQLQVKLFYFILDDKNVLLKKQGDLKMLFLHQMPSNTRIYDPNSNHKLLGKKMFIELFNQTPNTFVHCYFRNHIAHSQSIAPTHHRHLSTCNIYLLHHIYSSVRLEGQVFCLNLWVQPTHHMQSITNMIHQVVEGLKVGVIIPFNKGGIHVIQIPHIEFDGGHKIINKNVVPLCATSNINKTCVSPKSMS
jgi:hypothetical protein